jgi:hypothetical protein
MTEPLILDLQDMHPSLKGLAVGTADRFYVGLYAAAGCASTLVQGEDGSA